MGKSLMAAALAATAALALFAGGAAQAQPKPAPACFFTTEWNGWRATPDSRTIYIRVGVKNIYRLDLANECPELQQANAHLITHLHGSDSICSAVDFDLKVGDTEGFSVPCIVSNLSQLTPDEAAALPKNLRP